jgi:hypothetical protein
VTDPSNWPRNRLLIALPSRNLNRLMLLTCQGDLGDLELNHRLGNSGGAADWTREGWKFIAMAALESGTCAPLGIGLRRQIQRRKRLADRNPNPPAKILSPKGASKPLDSGLSSPELLNDAVCSDTQT